MPRLDPEVYEELGKAYQRTGYTRALIRVADRLVDLELMTNQQVEDLFRNTKENKTNALRLNREENQSS